MSPGVTLAHDDAHLAVADGYTELTRQGFVILPGLFTSDTIGALEHDLAPAFDNTPFCTGDFYGVENQALRPVADPIAADGRPWSLIRRS